MFSQKMLMIISLDLMEILHRNCSTFMGSVMLSPIFEQYWADQSMLLNMQQMQEGHFSSQDEPTRTILDLGGRRSAIGQMKRFTNAVTGTVTTT